MNVHQFVLFYVYAFSLYFHYSSARIPFGIDYWSKVCDSFDKLMVLSVSLSRNNNCEHHSHSYNRNFFFARCVQINRYWMISPSATAASTTFSRLLLRTLNWFDSIILFHAFSLVILYISSHHSPFIDLLALGVFIWCLVITFHPLVICWNMARLSAFYHGLISEFSLHVRLFCFAMSFVGCLLWAPRINDYHLPLFSKCTPIHLVSPFFSLFISCAYSAILVVHSYCFSQMQRNARKDERKFTSTDEILCYHFV